MPVTQWLVTVILRPWHKFDVALMWRDAASFQCLYSLKKRMAREMSEGEIVLINGFQMWLFIESLLIFDVLLLSLFFSAS